MFNFKVGKGVYIWEPQTIEGGDPNRILARLQMAGVQSVALKIADGLGVLKGLEPLVQVLKDNHILVAGWGYAYLKVAPQQEARTAVEACQRYQPDFYLIDAEAEVENNSVGADLFINVLRPALGDLPLGLNTFWNVDAHPLFPWTTFLPKVDFVCPQVYWRGVDPVGKLKQSQAGYASIPKAPQVPMPLAAGDLYMHLGVGPSPDQVTQFLAAVDTDPSLQGVFMWAADDTQTTPELWQAFSSYQWKDGGATLPAQPIGWVKVKAPRGLYIRATRWGTRLGALIKDQMVPIWSMVDANWAAITTAGDQVIYVGNPDYTQIVLDTSKIPPPPPPAPGLYTAKVIPAMGLNVRDGVYGNKLGVLACGSLVQVYEEKDGWARIDLLQAQWVNATYLGKMA